MKNTLLILTLTLMLQGAAVAATPTFDSASWSHDGHHVAFLKRDLDNDAYEVWVCQEDGAESHAVASFVPSSSEQKVALLGWSKDDTQVLVRRDTQTSNNFGGVVDPKTALWRIPVSGKRASAWSRGDMDGEVLGVRDDRVCVAVGTPQYETDGTHRTDLQVTDLDGKVLTTLSGVSPCDASLGDVLSPDLQQVSYQAAGKRGSQLVLSSLGGVAAATLNDAVPMLDFSERSSWFGDVGAVWAPDGQRVLVVRTASQSCVALYDLPAHHESPLLSLPTDSPVAVDWSANRMAYAVGDTLYVRTLDGGPAKAVFRNRYFDRVSSLSNSWQPQRHDRLLALVQHGGEDRLPLWDLDVIFVDGRPPLALAQVAATWPGAPRPASPPRTAATHATPLWSADATHLAYLRTVATCQHHRIVDKTFEVWSVALQDHHKVCLARWPAQAGELHPRLLGWSDRPGQVLVAFRQHVWRCSGTAVAVCELGARALLLGQGGSHIAWVDAHQVTMAGLDGKVLATAPEPDEVGDLCDVDGGVSPSGRYVLVPTQHAMDLLDIKAGTRFTVPSTCKQIWAWWTPDESAVHLFNGYFCDAMNLRTHATTQARGLPDYANVAVQANGARMAWTDENAHGLFCAPLQGTAVVTVQKPGGPRVVIDAHALSPDGKWIAFVRQDAHLQDVQNSDGPVGDLYDICIAATTGGAVQRVTETTTP